MIIELTLDTQVIDLIGPSLSPGAAGVSSWNGRTGAVLPEPADYDKLDKLDVDGAFNAGMNATAIGLGTDTPVDFGPGFRIFTFNGEAALGSMYFQNGGVTEGQLIWLPDLITLGGENDTRITLATNSDERLALEADGSVGFPNMVNSHPTEGWAHLAADGTLTRSVTRGNTYWAASKDDLPAPVAGVITLPADSSWYLIDHIDLGTDRIVCGGIATIRGVGAETSSITSNLAAGEAIIESEFTTTVRDLKLTVNAGAVCVRVDGSAQTPKPACDWAYVNFNGEGRACELIDVENSVNLANAVFGDGYYVFDSIQTLSFTESIFTPGDGQCGVCIEAGPPPIVNRRLRINNCAVIATGTGVAFDVPVASVAEAEGFVLDLVNFSGNGTYIQGVTYLNDEARFLECRGITNTARLGEFTWEGNATATVIASSGTYVKIAGTSVAGAFNQRFDHSNNRLEYVSELVETFQVTATMNLAANNNRVFAVQGRLNGATLIGAPQRSTTNGSGRSESITWQGIVQMGENDYIEMFIANETDTNNVTVEDISVQVLQA